MPLLPQGDSQGVMLIAIIAIFWTLAVVSVALRIWARHIKKVQFVINDYAIFVAIIFATGLAADSFSGVLGAGMGQHAENLTPAQLTYYGKMLIIGEIVWAFSNTAVKISILHLFIEIFWTRPIRIACYTLMTLATCLGTFILLSALLMCRPLAKSWDANIKGVCGNSQKSFLAQAIINLCVDISIVVLPIPVLWRLQMSGLRKLGIYFMFSVGIGICVITGLRIWALYLVQPLDPSYTQVRFSIFNNLEVFLGIFNACLPVTRPVFQKLFQIQYLSWKQDVKGSKTSLGLESLRKRLWGSHASTTDTYRSDKSNFEPLVEQPYALGKISGSRNQTTIERSTPDQAETTDLEARIAHPTDTKPNESIRITRGWDVNSS